MKKVVIYYDCSWEDIDKIRARFGIKCGVTINGETCEPVEIKDEDWEVLQETERRGYVKIRRIINQ